MLLKYYNIAKSFIDNFEMYYIPSESNTRADLFSNLVSTKKVGHFKTVIQETLQTPTIEAEEIMTREEEEPNWMTFYKNFLIRGVLPSNEDEAQHLRPKASYYVILDGELLKRGLTTPLLKCLNSQQADYVMRELHEGICGLHTRGRSLATKTVRAGYYWPTLRANALNFTKRCRRCQEFSNVPRIFLDNLHSLSFPWPFAMWGMNILGPLPKAPGAIIYRYDLPYAIVTNNDTQFKFLTYKDFLIRLGIKHLVTSIEHPQTNGQAEAANRVILRDLRTRLDKSKGL